MMLWFLRLSVGLGIAVALIGLYYGATVDWPQLQRAYGNFAHARGADLKTVFVAEAQQNIHRVNLFADIVWSLLGAIWATLGAIGLILKSRELK